MHKAPILAGEMESITTALQNLQDVLFNHTLSWNDSAALAYYAIVDAALDVARQVLMGNLAPSEELATALNTALLDEMPLPWAPVATLSA